MEFPDLLLHSPAAGGPCGQAWQTGVHVRAVVHIHAVLPIDGLHLDKRVDTLCLPFLILKVGMETIMPVSLGYWQD